MTKHNEIVIIGGGPVGLTTALKLAKQNKQIILIDKAFNYQHDARILALSFLSLKFITELGIKLEQLQHTKIKQVEVSHHGLGINKIKSIELGLPELGLTVSYASLCTELLKLVKLSPKIRLVDKEVTAIQNLDNYSVVEFIHDTNRELLTCDLLIMAEGGQLLQKMAKKRSYDYQQSACIFHITTQAKHNNIAYERFSGSGPLVLLPYDDHYVVVWSLATLQVNQLKDNDDKLINLLNNEFARRLGKIELISPVKSYELKLSQIKQRVHKHMVVVGNSAQTVHPVSAQGLNLGLRDVEVLSSILLKANYLNHLLEYDNLRNFDVDSVINFTHLLATKLDYSESRIVNHMRGLGLIGLSNLPSVKNFISRSLIFGL